MSVHITIHTRYIYGLHKSCMPHTCTCLYVHVHVWVCMCETENRERSGTGLLLHLLSIIPNKQLITRVLNRGGTGELCKLIPIIVPSVSLPIRLQGRGDPQGRSLSLRGSKKEIEERKAPELTSQEYLLPLPLFLLPLLFAFLLLLVFDHLFRTGSSAVCGAAFWRTWERDKKKHVLAMRII